MLSDPWHTNAREDWLLADCDWAELSSSRKQHRDAPADVIEFNAKERRRKIFEQLEDEIARSKSLLALGDNWDDDGAPAFLESTWQAATGFLRSFAEWLWRFHGTRIVTPRIRPGPDGSIDLLWKNGTRELIVNIPVDPEAPLAFYGDDPSNANCARGQFRREDFEQGPLAWLVRVR